MSIAKFTAQLIDAKDDLKELEKKDKMLEKERDDACDAVDIAEEEGETAEVINHLMNVKADTKFKIWLTGLVAEDTSDKRDEIMKKDLRLQNKSGQLVILGLDNAGKTTLLNTLKDDPLAQYVSNLYPTSEELIMGNIKFAAFDLGGSHAQAGRVWKDYFSAVDSIVFLVDATDRRRFAKAKVELDSLLTDEQIANAPIVILGTKNDLREAVSEERLREELGIFSATTEEGTADRTNINRRPMEIFMCNLTERGSFGQAFRWLSWHLRDI